MMGCTAALGPALHRKILIVGGEKHSKNTLILHLTLVLCYLRVLKQRGSHN